MRRQRVELLLPGGGGFPFDGGVKQQFTVARTMVEATLLKLKQAPDFQVCVACALHVAYPV